MIRPMHASRYIALSSIVLACAALGAEGPVVSAPGAGDWSIRWDAFSATSTFDLRDNLVRYMLSLEGELVAPEGARIVAIGAPQITEATDESGRSLLEARADALPAGAAQAFGAGASAEPQFPSLPYSTYSLSWRRISRRLCVSVGMLPELPQRIGHFAGQVHVLTSAQQEVIDIAAGELDDYKQVVSGLEVKLEPADTELPQQAAPDQPMLKIRKRFEPAAPAWHAPLILNLTFLDDQGRILHSHGWSVAHLGQEGGWLRSSFRTQIVAPPGQSFHALRLTVVTRTELHTIPFRFTDIPLP